MILNLSDVLSEQHKAIHESVPIEMTSFKSEMGDYAITGKTPLELSVEYAGDRKLEVTGKAEITSAAPCDRCLEDVEVKVTLDFKHKIDTESDAYDQSEDLDENNYIDGYSLDSKARRDKRRANWKMSAPNLVKCSKCGELMMPHRVCKHCGSYNQKTVIAQD